MQTKFTELQLADPQIRSAESALRKCVHCGFCLSACPTYALLGDERDSPRGRIYMIKQMLEEDTTPSRQVVSHLDKCLSCLACSTACPSGVDYQHLIDFAHAYVEKRHSRAWRDRFLRKILAMTLPYPARLAWLLKVAQLFRPFRVFTRNRWRKIFSLLPTPGANSENFDGDNSDIVAKPRRLRVAILAGCAQSVLRPNITDATVRLLRRAGCEVIIHPQVGCCGALSLHLGEEAAAKKFARSNIKSWAQEFDGNGLDAIVANASGCGTMIKDYGYLFRDDPDYAEDAQRVSELARDISELVIALGLPPSTEADLPIIAHHSACSLLHGQRVTSAPRDLLTKVGFTVHEPPMVVRCCGSAGTYNLLQPELADCMRDERLAAKDVVEAELIATDNIGCLSQLASGTHLPVAHTVELLDWATGGRRPPGV